MKKTVLLCTFLLSITGLFAQLAAPELYSPTDGATGISTAPYVYVNKVTNATSCTYQFDVSENFNSQEKRQYTSTSTSTYAGASRYYYHVYDLKFGTTYYWRAAVNNTTDTSAWSETKHFTTTDGVTLYSPADNATGISAAPTFYVNITAGSESCIYQLDTSENFDSPNMQQCTTSYNTTYAGEERYYKQISDLLFGTTYYWRAAVKNSSDTTDWSETRSFTTANAISLYLPADGATGISTAPYVYINTVPGAESYIYQLSASADFNPSYTTQETSSGTTELAGTSRYCYHYSDLKFGTTYYWRVAAKNSSDTSVWSEPRSFTTTDNISLYFPADGATGVSTAPYVYVNTVSGAESYIYQISTSADFNPSSTIQETSNGTAELAGTYRYCYHYSNLKFGTTYYWRVAAKNSSDTTDWSEIRSFTTTDNISLYFPADGATGLSTAPYVYVNTVPGAESYIYQLDTSADFSSSYLKQYTYGGTAELAGTYRYSYHYSDLLFGTTYYWRAAARNSSDTTDWSEIRSFTTANSITLYSPNDSATGVSISPAVYVNTVADAVSYIYQLDTSEDFNSPNLIQTEDATKGYFAGQYRFDYNYSGLSYGTTYYWRVAARNFADTSVWSETRCFTTLYEIDIAPTLTSPSNNSNNIKQDTSIKWNLVTSAIGYSYQISTNSNFTENLISGNVVTNELPVNLDLQTTYYWRIRAYNANGNSPWSETWKFKTKCPEISSEFSETTCDSYTWNATTYYESGDYERTLTTTSGCDSVVTLHLTITPPITSEISETACDSYTWNATTYYESGDYDLTLTAANGCDSTVTLHLTITSPITSEISETVCDSYTWNETTYYESGDYNHTLTAANGCDSIVTLHLTIETISNEVVLDNGTLSCTENGASYQWINCNNNELIANATESTFTPSISGNYAAIITSGTCTDTSDCQQIIIDNIDDHNQNFAELYPNPAKDILIIKSNYQNNIINIVDISGKSIKHQSSNEYISTIDISEIANGTYFITIENAENITTKKLIISR